jgi:hypothetical protein
VYQHIDGFRARQGFASKQAAEYLPSFRYVLSLLIALRRMEEKSLPLAFLLMKRQRGDSEEGACGLVRLLHLSLPVTDDHTIVDGVKGGPKLVHT